jgi:hypothetical protein
MKMSINLEVSVINGNLVLTDKEGGIVTFSKDQVVQKKVSMVTLGELSNLPKIQIAKTFGYSTRKSYYDIRNAVLNGSIKDLIPEPTGPKSAPKRTRELEVLIIKMRFETDYNMYEIADKLKDSGFDVSPRLIGQILTDYGLSKKKPLQSR